MDIHHRLIILQEQVARQAGARVDCYYQEGYGALFVHQGYPLHPNFVIFAFPDIAIRQGINP